MTVFSVPKNLSKANEIFVSLLIPVFSVLVFLLFFETHYVENDDVLMASISSGSYSGKTSEYLVFTNFLIGFFLKWINEISNTINWYTVYLYLTHTFSLSVIFYCLLQKSKSLISATLFFLTAFALINVNLLQDLQFTTTSAVAGVAGLSLFFMGRDHISEKVLSVFLIVFSSMIRFETTVLLLLSTIPVLVVTLKRSQKNKIIVLAIALTGVLGCQLANNQYYQSNTEWSNFLKYNKIRGDIQENKYFYNYQQVASTLKELNWSEDDFYLFKGFSFDNSTKYSLGNLEKIYKEVNQLKISSLQKELNFSTIYNGFVHILFKFKGLFFLSFLLFGFNRQWRRMLFIQGAILTPIFILTGLELLGYPVKERVIQINLVSTTVLCIFTFIEGVKLNWLIAVLTGLFFSYSMYITWIKGLSIEKERTKNEMAYSEILALTKNKLTVISNYVFKPEALSPFQSNVYPHHFYTTGWTSGIPFNRQKIKDFTNSPEIENLNCLSKSSDFQWIFNSKIEMNNFLQSLLKKNYPLGQNRLFKIKNSNSGIYIIK